MGTNYKKCSEKIKRNLQKTLKFSYSIDKQDQLLFLLFRLGHGSYNNGNEYVCFLYNDFSPHSFLFSYYNLEDCEIAIDNQKYLDEDETILKVKMGKKPWLSGGLIYHGRLPDGSKPETFSVELNPSDGWSIHT
mgnify:FL=1